jgi:hypothetical protein
MGVLRGYVSVLLRPTSFIGYGGQWRDIFQKHIAISDKVTEEREQSMFVTFKTYY